MTEFFFLFVALASLIAYGDFRRGIYFAVAIDLMRDIVRKSDPTQSVLITVAGAAVWGAVFLGALRAYPGVIRRAYEVHPSLRKSISIFVIGLIPAAGLSVVLYGGGYKLAIVGGISFLAPLLGLVIGYALPRTPRDIYSFLAFYVVVNAVFLIGVPLEQAGFDWEVLGGMRGMEWIRHRPGYVVDLISGFYRSPDIMGLHASTVVMFSFCHLLRPGGRTKAPWLIAASWAFFCLFLAGRRKMIGMPFVFLASWFLIGAISKIFSFSRMLGILVVCALPIGVSLMVLGQNDGNDEYSNFAATLATEGVTRTNEIVSDSVLNTVYETGIFGSGLGSATQGRYYARGVPGTRGWQEDGVSRIFKELGLFGVICVLIAAKHLFDAIRRSLENPYADHAIKILQLSLLAMVIAFAASFAVSHQAFSGDPGSAIIVMILFGAFFACFVDEPPEEEEEFES